MQARTIDIVDTDKFNNAQYYYYSASYGIWNYNNTGTFAHQIDQNT